jgi:hypothetical protein
MPRAQHMSMRAAGKTLLQPQRKKHSAKLALGSVLAYTCTTRMIPTTRTTFIEAHSAPNSVAAHKS